ncbi:MAG: flagellar basal body L-ring protein FlgH [Methylobacteriaceae bacterium]|nr:flagellar basal body L-ring protein FlgH [Methylobacteriaceae bacterium]
MRPWITLLPALCLAACSADIADVGRAPSMTAVGSGILQTPQPAVMSYAMRSERVGGDSLWDGRNGDLFRDRRAARVGDILTVNISINDRASLGNTSDRSRDSKVSNSLEILLGLFGLSKSGDASLDIASQSSTKGKGAINRSEKIQLSIAAVVTDVMANGNLMISGSQEVRVDFELRTLQIAGVVRPRDVARDNTIAYDKIAEARISYGGRGRITEMQQPGVVHQLYDRLTPF